MKPLANPASSHPSAPRSFFRLALLASCLLALLAAPGLHAATVVWDGSGDATWTNPDSNSWSGNTYNNGDAAQFLGAGSGTVTLSGTIQPGSVLVDSANNYTFSGVLSGAGSLTKNGSGTLTLASTNTYTGGTTVNAGTLRLSAGPSGGSLVINSGANVTASNHGMYGFSTITINGGTLNTGGLLQRGSNNALTMTNGTITGGGDWAASSYTLNRNNTINTQIGDRSATFNVVSGTTTVSGEIRYHWGGNVTKTGAGTLNLTGTNTYGWNSVGGQTFLNAGTLGISNSKALGSGYGAFTINGGTIDNLSAGAITLTNNNAQNWNADFTFAGTRDLNMGTGAVTMNASRTVTVNAGNFTVGGVISGAGFGLTKNGNGKMVLSGANTYSGATMVNAGTLQLGGGGTTGTLSTSSAISTGSGGVFSVNRTNTVTQGTDFSGSAITGTGGFLQAGSGTTILNATNTYNGSTTINAGTLQIDGNIANSGLVINSGATISPGTTAAADSFGTSSITINGGGYNWTLNNAYGSAGTDWDQITSTGALTSSGVLTVNIYGNATGWDDSTNYSWDIFSAASLSGSFNAANFGYTIAPGFGVTPTGTFSFSNPGGGIIRMTYTAPTGPVWTGSSGNWSTGFSANVTNGDAIAFSGTSGGTATNNISSATLTTLDEIEFRSGAGAYTLAANAGSAGASGSSALTVTGSIINNSANTQTINMDVAPGSIAINSGALEIGAAGRLNSGSYSNTISNSVSLIYSGTNAQTLSGDISGTGALTKNAASTLTLTGNNTYSGATTINAGTLEIGGAGRLGGGSYAGNIAMAGAFTYNSTADQTLSGQISGGGILYKYGTGTLTLSGSNSRTGTLKMGSNTPSLTAGTVKLGHNNSVGTGGNIEWENDGTLELAVNGLTISNANYIYARNSATDGKRRYRLDLNGSNTGTFSGNFDIRMSGLLFDVGTDDTLTLSGNMTTGAGTGGLEKTGAGTLILTRANTYTGGTTVNAGTLQIGDGSNTTAAVAGTTTLSGGNLSYNYNAAKFDVNGAITLTAEATITKLNSSFQMNFGSGTLNGGGQTLNISSAGNLPIYFNQTYGTALGHINILSGIAAQADTALPLRNATMNISNGAQFRTWTVGTINNNITLNGGAGPNGTGALYNEHTTSPTYSGTITLADATNSTIGSASTGGITISGQVTGGGSLTKNNTFTLTLSGNNTYTGTTTVNAGTLTLGANQNLGAIAGAGALNLASYTLTTNSSNDTTFSGIISGTGGSLTKNGTSTLTLTNASNSYTGGTTLNTGTLVIGNAAAAGTGTITQSDGTSLLKFDTIGTITNAMSIYNVSANKTVTLSGGITVNNAVFDVASGETLTISNTINGTGGVTKNGDGTLVLSGSNTYSAPTTINAGTLEAANAGALGSNNTVTVNDGTLLVSTDDAINGRQITLNGTSTTVATLAFSGNYTGSIGKLTLSANSIIDLGQGNIGLQFADMAMGFYNLSIYNWSGTNYWGTTYGTGTDQLYFNGNYTASNVKFYSGAVGSDSFVGSGFDLGLQQTSWDAGLSGHYIIPVPEPETYATGLLLVLGSGVWLWRKRKKFTTQSNLEGAAPSAPIEKW